MFGTFKLSPRSGRLKVTDYRLINKFRGLLKWTEKKQQLRVEIKSINFKVRNCRRNCETLVERKMAQCQSGHKKSTCVSQEHKM